MLDFIEEGSVPILYYFFYWLSILYIFLRAQGEKNVPLTINVSTQKTIRFAIFFVFFSVVYLVGRDYFQYRYHIQSPPLYISSNGQEKVYQYLYIFCNGNYELFRIIVWGGAILLYALSAKKSRMPVYYALLFWFFFFCDKICYARASLGMAVLFLGLCYLVFESNVIKKYIIGISAVLISTAFHRSLFMLMPLIPVLFVKVSRRNILFYSIASIIIGVLLIKIGFDSTSLLSVLDEGGLERVEGYQESIFSGEGGWNEVNILGRIMNALSNLFFFFIFFDEMRIYLAERDKGVNENGLFALCKLSWGIILLSIAFLVFFKSVNPFYYRCLFMSHIPLALCFTDLYMRGLVSPKKYMFYFGYAFFLHTIIFLDALN